MKKLFYIFLWLFICLSTTAQNKIDEIDILLNSYTNLNLFNGNLMVIREGKTFYKATHQINNPSSDKLNMKTILPIGSLSKSFTALIILKLQEEQKLSLNDQLSKYIPDYPNGNKIFIKHLLSHSSGIYESYRNPKYFQASVDTNNITPIEKLTYFKNEPLDFNPGADFSYSNSGYDLLGVIIEKITLQSYGEAVKKYIFGPLKMKNSGYNYDNLKKKKTIGYSYLSKNRKKEAKLSNGTYLYSSGGLYSTMNDLKKFYKGLIKNEIISKQSFELATSIQQKQYGYGWFIDEIGQDIVINHGGNLEGFTSYFLMNVEKKICIIALNTITSTSLEKVGNSIYKLMTDKPYTLPKPKKEIFPSLNVLKKYIGNYEVSATYSVSTELKEGSLVLKINDEEAFKLSAETDHTFFVAGENMIIEFFEDEKNNKKIKIVEGLSTKIGDKI